MDPLDDLKLKHQYRSPDQFVDPECGAPQGEEARAYLLLHGADLITPDVIAQFAQVVKDKYATAHALKRERGESNDFYSPEPGIRIYLNQVAREKLTRNFTDWDYDFKESDFEEVEPGIFCLTLPEGSFSAGGGGALQLFKSNDANPEGAKLTEPFNMAYGDIFRMEGLNDLSLWQNRNHNWDFTPKETPSAE